MGNPILDIKGQIGGAIDGVASLIGMGSGISKYPSNIKGNFLNQVEEDSGDWKSSRGYEFRVRERIDGGYKDHKDWLPLRLQINPQELTQDDIFAVEVSPTFGGVLVEHQGSLLKDITISGTTGISPLRKDAGAMSNGRPVLASGHSGYMEFHELRNYFRAYAAMKRDPKGRNLAMSFRNWKDSEYLIVEPLKFKMKRTASKAMSYDYTIDMKSVDRDIIIASDTEWYEDAFDKFLQAAQFLEDAAKVFAELQSFIISIVVDFVDGILGPIETMISSLRSIGASVGGWSDGENGFTKRLTEVLDSRIKEFENILGDKLGRDNSKYNEALGRMTTVDTTSASSGRSSTYDELRILNACQKVKKAISITNKTNELYEDDSNAGVEAVNAVYAGKTAINPTNSSKEVTILGSDNIHSIAARELGSPDMFRDIVIMNNLKPPYIVSSDDGDYGDGVLRPGEKLLIPSKASGPVTTLPTNKEYNITKALAEFEKNMGVDIGVTETGDFLVSNVSDYDMKAGLDNLSQAIFLKLFLNRGSLKRHSQVGTGLEIGAKNSSGLDTVVQEIEQSILFDNRVESVPFITAEQDGNITRLKMLLSLKDVDQPVPVPLNI